MTQVMTRQGPRRAKLCLPVEVTEGLGRAIAGWFLGTVVQAAPGGGVRGNTTVTGDGTEAAGRCGVEFR